MHELGIVFHVIKHVEQVGQAHGLSAVRRVTWSWERSPGWWGNI